MISTDAAISFTELCTLFDNVATASNSDDKRKCLKDFITSYQNKANQLSQQHSNFSKSFYPVLRLLLPNEERDRGPYNLKEFTFIKTIINILGLSQNGQDANLLRNYKVSNNRNIKHFADAAHFVLKKSFNNVSSLTVFQVNEFLDEISAKANDIRSQENTVLRLFQTTSQFEQKWVVRMLLKELRLGIGRDNILKAFHPDAADLYNNVHSLTKICQTLQDPSIRINFTATVAVFDAFQPMLSTRCNSDELHKAFKVSKPYIIENKFDGERFQMHFKDGTFKYFSRQGFDYSENYGDTYSHGFSSKLLNVFRKDVRSLILDGEMMIWNKSKKIFGSKGMTVDVKKLKSDHPKFTPCFCVFDILLLNDEVLMRRPLKERLSLLQEIITPKEGVINVSQQSEAQQMTDVITALNSAMDKEEEGIVFKDPDSVYSPGSRSGWWKMKLEYFENVMSDLDVLIIGGYYGDGSQRKNIQGFLLGVIDKSGSDLKYLSFAKIQSGLGIEEHKVLKSKLNTHWKKVDGNEHECHNIYWGKEAPDVWIQPEYSCCLLVRGSELIKVMHNTYRTSYTIRFPRILKIRLDKPYHDCLTADELNSLTKSSSIVQKLNKRHLELSDIKVPKKRAKKEVDYTFAPVDNKSDTLEGYEFLVLSGKGSWTKDNVEIAIRENGGTIVKAEGKKTCCMLAGDDHLRIKTYKDEIDIVNIEWLRRILNEGEFVMYTLQDMIYTSPKTKKIFSFMYDKFGDPFTQQATVGSIQKIVKEVTAKSKFLNLSHAEIKELFAEINFAEDPKVFRNFKVYFDKFEIIGDPNSDLVPYDFLEEIDFIHRGGTVCDTLSEDCYIISKGNSKRIADINFYLKCSKHAAIVILKSPEELLKN